MQSGCPRSQGGAYSAFHRSNAALLSPEDTNVAPVPVNHPGTKIQNGMVASQYPEKVRVAYGPAQLHQQHFQGLHHQRTSQASLENNGFQHPVPGDGARSSPNSCQPIREANANSSAHETHVSAQPVSYFGTSANNTSCSSGQQSRFCKQNFNRCLQKGSILNHNTGLQPRRHVNCALSDGTNPAALQGDGFEFTAQTLSSQDMDSSVRQRFLLAANPLLTALLKKNLSDSESITASSMSAAINVKGQKVKGSLLAVNSGPTGTQNLDHSGGTLSTPQVSFPSVSSQPSTDKVLPVGERKPCTDDEIYEFIAQQVAYYTALMIKYGHSYKESDNVYSVAHLPTTSASHKEDLERQCLNYAVVEECTAAQAVEDSSWGSKANPECTPKSKEMGDCASSASEKHPTGTLVSVVENSKRAHSNSRLVCSDDCRDKTFVPSTDESFYTKGCDKYLKKDMTPLHYSTTALKELVVSLENVETITEMENFSKVMLQEYWNGNIDNVHLFASTEYPQIMMKVAATCTKNEDPGVLTAVPGMTWDKLTEKQPRSILKHRLSQQEYKSPWLSINKNLDDLDQVPRTHEFMMERGDTALKQVKGLQLDTVQVAGVSENLQIKTSSVVSENKTLGLASHNLNENIKIGNKIDNQQHCSAAGKEVSPRSELKSPVDDIQIHNVVSVPTSQREGLSNQISCECVREDAGSVHSQTSLSIALYQNQVTKQTTLPKSKHEEASHYEDISDDDTSQVATKLPNAEHKELGLPASFSNPHYEDISEDESPQNESVIVETSSPAQVPEPNDKRTSFENEDCGHGRGQTERVEIVSDVEPTLKKKVPVKAKTPDRRYSSHYVETDCGSEDALRPECDFESQTNHSVSCSSSSILKYEDDTDDQMDDEYLVIPLSMLELRFEPEDEDQHSPEKDVPKCGETGLQERHEYDTSPTYSPSPKQGLASAFPTIPVYDTHTCFLQAVQTKNRFEVASDESTPEPEQQMDSESELFAPRKKTESVDSCETEDSSDYSSASEHNYLTVSSKMMKKRSAPLSSVEDFFASEKGGKGSEVTNMQKDQTRRIDQLDCNQIEVKAGCSKHVQPKTKGQKIPKEDNVIVIDSDTEDESDQSCKKKVKRKRKKRLFSSDSEDSDNTSCSQQKRHPPMNRRHGTVKEKSPKRRPVDSPAPQYESPFEEVTSEHVQHNRQKISKRKCGIILDSDTEDDDDDDQNCKKPRRKRFFSSSSEDAPCIEPETVDREYGTAKEKLQETRPDLSQHQSKLCDTQFTKAMHKANKETMSKRRVGFADSDTVVRKGHVSNKMAKGILSSGSEDGDIDLIFGTAYEKPPKNKQSTEVLPKKQPQVVDKEADPTPRPKPVIPRYVVVKPSQSNKRYKLIQESRVPKQVKDGTKPLKASISSSKQTDSSFPHVYRGDKGRFAAKPANDRLHAEKDNVQATAPKPRRFSTPLSLPQQEAPATSFSSSSSTSQQPSDTRQNSSFSRSLSLSGETSSSSSFPPSKQSKSHPRQHLSSSKLPQSRSLNLPPTKGPSSSSSTMRSSPLKCDGRVKVIENWQNSYFPTRRDRKSSLEENFRAVTESWREARPGPSHDKAPRQRHNSHKAAPPLMKKTRTDAIHYTKARNRDAQNEKRSSVGEGYKWSEGNTGKVRRLNRWERYSPPPPCYD